jgi:hypothetical protein
VNVNGEDVAPDGVSVPPPFSVSVTLVALPPKVLPLIDTAVVPHVVPLLLLRVTVGGLRHPQEIENITPTVVQPAEFLTAIK